MMIYANFSIAVSIWAALFFSISLAVGDGSATASILIASGLYVVAAALAIGKGWLSSGWWGSVIAVLLAVLLTGWPWILGDSVSFAATTQALGAGAMAFLALACLVPIGSSLVLATHQYGFPVIWTLLAWVAMASFWSDNHAVRRIDATPPMAAVRPTLESAAKGWLDCITQGRSPIPAQNGQTPVPMVVIATAGGATRAALWTGTVLGLAQDKIPHGEFSKHLFALSGVSGGAVGLAFTVAHLREQKANAAMVGRSLAKLNEESIGQDFLSSAVAGMMFPDLINQLIPALDLPDRAQALELGWEYGWKTAYGSQNLHTAGLAERFENIRPYEFDGKRTDCEHGGPVLLFNGTHEETGRRILTTNVRFEANQFVDALNFEQLADGPIRLSTAALNTARFPYVSPAGTLYKPADGLSSRGHILDGGYYENYGAQTAGEALKAALQVVRTDPNNASSAKVQVEPVVILISSDPDLRFEDIDPDPNKCLTGPDALPTGPRWANDARAPIDGLFATRSARGIAAAKNLCEQTGEIRGDAGIYRPVFIHFRMCKVGDEPAPGLTWKLSPASLNFIASKLPYECGNDAQFERLFMAFGIDGGKAHEMVVAMREKPKKEPVGDESPGESATARN